MIVGVVRLIAKRYVSHGWVEVPKKYRFVFEMINLVVMFASLGLNLALALLVAQRENHLLLIFCGLQVVMLIIVLFYTCSYWTVGSGSRGRTEADIEEPLDAVTITIVNPKANCTFRYWIFLIHEITFLLCGSLTVFVAVRARDFSGLGIPEIVLIVSILSLSLASLALTYLYSTDMFILVPALCVSWRIHRLYPLPMTVSRTSLQRNTPLATKDTHDAVPDTPEAAPDTRAAVPDTPGASQANRTVGVTPPTPETEVASVGLGQA